jgi:outer membrane beta-barrel protein
MEGRLRIIFLKLALSTIVLLGMGLANVVLAEEKEIPENYDIGIVFDGETKTVSEPSQVDVQKGQPQTPAQPESKSIKAVPLEKNSTQVIQPAILRRKIDIDDIDTEDFEIGGYVGLLSTEDFGANMVIGVRAAYHITEHFFAEAAYGISDTTETSYERLSGGAQLLTPEDRKLTYYNISLGYNLFPGEAFLGDGLAFNTSLYVIGGAGITKFAGDNRFTVNFGVGYRLLATDWLAVHFDVRDHIFDIDLLGVKKTAHNLETHGGMTVFF